MPLACAAFGPAGRQRHVLLEVIQRLLHLALVHVDHARQVVRLGVVRIGLECLLERRLGLGVLAGVPERRRLVVEVGRVAGAAVAPPPRLLASAAISAALSNFFC